MQELSFLTVYHLLQNAGVVLKQLPLRQSSPNPNGVRKDLFEIWRLLISIN